MWLDQGRITAQQSFHVSGSFLTASSILPRKASVAQAISALLDRKAIALPQIPRSPRQSSEDVSRNLGHQGIVEVPSPLGASNSHDRSYFGPQTQHRGPIA